MRPEWGGGIVPEGGSSACSVASLTLDAETAPFTAEVGTRAIYAYLDAVGQTHFTPTELLGAATAVKVKTASGWAVRSASATVEVAPRHGVPASFSWLGPKAVVVAKGSPSPWAYQTESGVYQQASTFALLDAFGNLVAGWGPGDSTWHTSTETDKVYITTADGSPNTWGTPPWAVLKHDRDVDPTMYTPWEMISDPT